MLKDAIIAALAKATGLPEEKIHLEFPENEQFGDYSTNVALQGENPRKRALEIKAKLEADKSLKPIVEKVEVAGPGFINFYLSPAALQKNLTAILKEGKSYGRSKNGSGQKIMFEFGQPNTHKVPHIGHLFSYIYGEAMCRILTAGGYKVNRANYQGDVGLHVAKCLWAFQKENPDIPTSLSEKVDLLQKMYQSGSKAYEEDETAKEEIQDINKKIYEMDASIKPLWEKTRGWSVEFYKDFEKRLGIKFDRYYFESEVYKDGMDIVKKNIGKVFKESQGAIIFEGSKYGLHDRVFLTQFGTPTYEAKDMALERFKKEEWPAALYVITTANEQNSYFDVVFKALEVLDKSFTGKLKHIGFGMVNLKGGKMSSRTGEIVGAVELVNLTVDEIKKIIAGREDLSGKEREEIAEKVGVGAVKYSFLKNNPLQDTAFDLEESISTEGNSGPYLQYTAARANSVLRKAKTAVDSQQLTVNSLNPEELSVLRTLTRFQEIVLAGAIGYSPNILCEYLFDLAQKYNNLYNNHKIIGSENEDFRLALTAAVAQVLADGLNLLGIEAPEKM